MDEGMNGWMDGRIDAKMLKEEVTDRVIDSCIC